MQIAGMDYSLATQMQMVSQMSSVTQDSQMSAQNQVAKVEENMSVNEEALAGSIEALASGTVDGDVVTEVYA